MPLTLEWDGQIVIQRVTGEVNVAEVLASKRELQGDPRFDRLRFLLQDLTGMTGWHLSPLQIEQLEAFDRGSMHINPSLRRAFVVRQELVAPMETGLRSVRIRGYETRFFTSHADARAWFATFDR